MNKPTDYEQAQSYDSDFKRLPAGGYVVEIKKIEETTTRTGKAMLIMSFEIKEGEYAGFFTEQYRKETAGTSQYSNQPKWRGTYNVFPLTPEGNTNPQYKGLLTSIEKSNGIRINWNADYNQFVGKIVGILFREEEFINYEGNMSVAIKAYAARPADVIRNNEYEAPKRKVMKDNVGSSNGYVPAATEASGFTSVTVDDDDLPF